MPFCTEVDSERMGVKKVEEAVVKRGLKSVSTSAGGGILVGGEVIVDVVLSDVVVRGGGISIVWISVEEAIGISVCTLVLGGAVASWDQASKSSHVSSKSSVATGWGGGALRRTFLFLTGAAAGLAGFFSGLLDLFVLGADAIG